MGIVTAAALLMAGVSQLAVADIHCEVFGGIAVPPQVVLGWDAVDSNIQATELRVLRDGELVASLNPAVLGYEEEPLHGEHVYTVIAIVAGGDITVGSCVVDFDPPKIGGFRRGDCNVDGTHDISDVICILRFAFAGTETDCIKSTDTDDNGIVELTDAVALAQYLFLGGPQPAEPFSECDDDPTPDALSCDRFGPCFNPPPP